MTVEFPPNTSIGRNALAVLASLPVFADLEAEALISLAEKVEWFCLPGDTVLFEQGDESDSLYAVTSGTLGAYRVGDDGARRLIGRIKRGETVGEAALVSGSRRTASVVAMRDSELLRFSTSAFELLARDHPAAMMHVAQLTLGRLERTLRRAGPRTSSKTFAIVGVSRGVDEERFATRLAAELSALGKTELFTGDSTERHTSAWFNEVESRRDFVLYVADRESTAWTRQCIAQADSVVLLANARGEPRGWQMLDMFREDGSRAQTTELVLQHRRIIRPGTARHWLDRFRVAQHHHLRGNGDMARLARLLTGNAVGLVLGGGGARGFGHIGVVRALREAGVPIDHCGGTSVGSIIAAGVAAGWDDEQLVDRNRRTFVERNPLGDYTLPLIALTSGRRVSRLLASEVGDLDIADLALPYFCVATNLTRGSLVVYRSGKLWRRLRAAVAIPGVLPPVFENNEIFVDGAVLNNLPVDVMRDMGRGAVIGVDVGSEQSLVACEDVDDLSVLGRLKLLRERRAPNIFQLLLRAGSLSSSLVSAANREQSSILLTPPLADVDMLDWRAFDRAVEAGYRHACERMDEIGAALEEDRPGARA